MRGSLDHRIKSLLASLPADDRQRALECVEANWSRGWEYWATGCVLMFFLLVFGVLGATTAVQIIGGEYAAQLGILVGFLVFLPVEPLITSFASQWRLQRLLRAKLGINLNRNSVRLPAGAAVSDEQPGTTRRPVAGRLRR